MKTSNDTIKLVGFSLLTGIVGAGIGILFAPHKGSKTRKKLKKGAKGDVEDIIKGVKHKTNDLMHY